VTYTWDNTDTLTIDYKAKTDKATYLNLTNHSYFNLSGDYATTIEDHLLRIDADKFVAISDTAIPVSLTDVKGTAFDFTTPKTVGRDIDSDTDQCRNGKGYDHPFMLKENRDVTKAFAKVHDAKTGRAMEVFTTEKFVICYSGNHLINDVYVYNQIPIKPRAGICLETQDCPDHMHFNDVSSYVLRPEDTYQSQTKYRFYCE
jgi:aldose 1-epimerase